MLGVAIGCQYLLKMKISPQNKKGDIYFADDVFNDIFLIEMLLDLIEMSLKCVGTCPMDNTSPLVEEWLGAE